MTATGWTSRRRASARSRLEVAASGTAARRSGGRSTRRSARSRRGGRRSISSHVLEVGPAAHLDQRVVEQPLEHRRVAVGGHRTGSVGEVAVVVVDAYGDARADLTRAARTGRAPTACACSRGRTSRRAPARPWPRRRPRSSSAARAARRARRRTPATSSSVVEPQPVEHVERVAVDRHRHVAGRRRRPARGARTGATR